MAKILLADDDPAIRQLYGLEFKRKGFTVTEAVDGEDALSKAKGGEPDLIILDIMMPKMDGIMTLKKLKEDGDLKKIPVLMLTNFGQESLIKEAFNFGLADYILKYKITPAELADKINQVLSARSPVL